MRGDDRARADAAQFRTVDGCRAALDPQRIHQHQHGAVPHDQSGQRRRQPQEGNLVGARSKKFIDGAHVRHLQSPAELDAEETETHIPDLPEISPRFLHLAPVCQRSYVFAISLSRVCSSSVSAWRVIRQRQFPLGRPGRFMRASLPNPSTSCTGTTTVSATEDISARMSAQWMSAEPAARYRRANARSSSMSASVRTLSPPALFHHPTTVSLSCVPL